MLLLFQTYKTLIFHISLSISLTLLLVFLKIPIYFLLGIHTYIHPDNVPQQNGLKAAIRRPSDPSSSQDKSTSDLKRRHKSKDKFEFDENNAQIFRLRLDDSHLQSRIYFDLYWYSFIYSFVAISSLLLYKYLDVGGDKDGILTKGSVIPLVLGFGSVCKLLVSLTRVSFELSASKRSEKQLSVLIGVLGFFCGVLICSGAAGSVLDFDFGLTDGYGRVSIAVLMGVIAGVMYMPAGKNARSFWLGTDQLRSNLAMISCGWIGRMILYANNLVIFFTALLWINPLIEIFINKSEGTNLNSSSSVKDAQKSVVNFGFTQSEFTMLRLGCLLLSGVVQIVAVRPNLQMYLNEALLCWYQRLHASKVPDLEYSRAKVFLHNHYLCLVVLQFFAPPILVHAYAFAKAPAPPCGLNKYAILKRNS
ncbi:hypothetical protein M5689_017810 [Euphorbia peplus]|nr:hypothetical protein M5689_017810 [Euphorbia peplus]